ncbi:MAG: DUF1192 domain-containing protein [Pseudomonadota bacterium]
MFEDEDEKKEIRHTLGADLTAHSVEELRKLADVLREETARVEAEMTRKSADLDAASAFFKT